MIETKQGMLILVTGATGKVGRAFVAAILANPAWRHARIRALCHNRKLSENDRIAVVNGSIAERGVVDGAMRDVTHVVHLATCKETPEDVVDVAIGGLFWLLEAFRTSKTARQFMLIGGDAAIGHFFYRHPGPITEAVPHMAYPGCYALSKVLEEVMLQQYFIQYGIEGCCLRAPWIMEKDDFKYTLSFGADVFGGPVWRDLVPAEAAERYHRSSTIPLLLDVDKRPLKRNFVHVDDLVAAMLAALDNPRASRQLFNICMDEPVDYGIVAQILARSHGLPAIEIESDYHSNWMDNSKARYLLDWRPRYDTEKLIEAAWTYQRAAADPRKVWYPG